jgi:hypothetical protein
MLTATAALIGAVGWVALQEDGPTHAAAPVEKPVERFMRQKLQHSEEVLEGLVVEDFEQIKEAADGLKTMSLAADWQVIRSPTYDQYSREFRTAADDLAKAAAEKNIDGASLAYLRVTMSCIRCHKHVRGAEVTALPPLPRRTETPSIATTPSPRRAE